MKKIYLLILILLITGCGNAAKNDEVEGSNDSSYKTENILMDSSSNNPQDINGLQFCQEGTQVTIKNTSEVDALIYLDEILIEQKEEGRWVSVNTTSGLITMIDQLAPGSEYVYSLPEDLPTELRREELRGIFHFELMGQGKKSVEIYFD